jgi:hypothetical protein
VGLDHADADADRNQPLATTMTSRLLFAASALPSRAGRTVIALLCSSRRVRQITRFELTRDRLKRRFGKGLNRVLEFAKHEALRKLHRYMFRNRPLVGQDETGAHSDAARIAFDPDQLRQDLVELLRMELPSVLSGATQETLDALGYRDPWKLPAQDALDLIASRENLISGLPDELFGDVQSAISDGLKAGESLDQISNRILTLFDEFTSTRADLIAQTETSAAYGFASHAAAVQAGVLYKQWLHAGFPKIPREDHLEIDGLIMPIDEPYPVGEPPLMYPHDPDGSAEDVINCGCISIPATEEDYQKQ